MEDDLVLTVGTTLPVWRSWREQTALVRSKEPHLQKPHGVRLKPEFKLHPFVHSLVPLAVFMDLTKDMGGWVLFTVLIFEVSLAYLGSRLRRFSGVRCNWLVGKAKEWLKEQDASCSILYIFRPLSSRIVSRPTTYLAVRWCCSKELFIQKTVGRRFRCRLSVISLCNLTINMAGLVFCPEITLFAVLV